MFLSVAESKSAWKRCRPFDGAMMTPSRVIRRSIITYTVKVSVDRYQIYLIIE